MKRNREHDVIPITLGKRLKVDRSDRTESDPFFHIEELSLLGNWMNLLRGRISIYSRKALECLQYLRKYMEIAHKDPRFYEYGRTCCYDLAALLRAYLLWSTSHHQLEAVWILSSKSS
jgi:hypothetical protein